MRAIDIIIKKRDKGELVKDEIEYFVDGIVKGEIPDYQIAAWAMAVLLNGMTDQETTDLTMAIAYSGEVLDLSDVVPIAVDKHSTGGVGDKTTLVVEPIVAACGLPVGKMSGRGLGFSGGTLDKMESIPGYRTDLSQEEFLAQLRTIGLVLTGQTRDLAPADGKLYALRDVTGTVPSIPLIASSVMSKKIAAGAHAIVLDVKTGLGAFMETVDDAKKLSELMVSIGRLSGRKVIALISDMNQPLGNAVGNSLELIEAIATLHNGGPEDFREHCISVASHMLVLGEKALNEKSGRKMAVNALENGTAWDYFEKLVQAQGGDLKFIQDISNLPDAKYIETIKATESGYILLINAREIGETAVEIGAGREKKGDPIDHAVGIIIHHKVGDFVNRGDLLASLHINQQGKIEHASKRVLKAHQFSKEPVSKLPLFYDVIR